MSPPLTPEEAAAAEAFHHRIETQKVGYILSLQQKNFSTESIAASHGKRSEGE